MCATGAEGGTNSEFGELLLEYGADVNQKNDAGLTALDYAAEDGTDNSVRYLLQNGAMINDKTLEIVRNNDLCERNYGLAKEVYTSVQKQNVNYDQYKIFGLAVLGRTKELIAEIQNNNGEYESDIPFYAAGYCDPEALAYFVSQGFDLTQQDEDENSLLWIASSTGNLEVVKYLIESGVSLDFSNYESLLFDPLKISVVNNHYETTKFLLEQGAQFNIDEALGYDGSIGDLFSGKMKANDSFQGAAQNGNIEMIKLLEDNGFPMDENTYYRALKIAIVYNQREVIKYTLDRGADPDYVDNRFADNDSLLEICATNGNVEILKLLDEYGVTIKTKDSDALANAVDAGNYEIAKYLLEKGMDVNSHRKYDDGSESFTAWFEAGGHGYFDMIKLLLAHGADINDKSAIMLTRYAKGSEHITKYLIENGADVDIRGSENNTALCIAALNHRTENAKMLLEAGADTTLKNDEGKTALDIAKKENAKEIVELLENSDK